MLIYVIDSTDDARQEEIEGNFRELMAATDLQKVPVLVFANKQDLGELAKDAGTISNELSLAEITGRDWNIQACSGLSGEGLEEGMRWVIEKINERNEA